MKGTSFLFLVLLSLPFFVALEDASLWDSNEAFYAQTPREMIERGDWIVPYFNGQPRLNKPPLSYWIVAACYRLFSVSVFWERLPMALLAYGSVLVLFWIGRILFQEEVALWAAAIFATTFRFLILSRRLFIDVLMLFCLLVAIAFFLSWLKENKKHHFLLCALFFGLAFLAKGPVALLPIAALGLYLIFSDRVGLLSRAPWLASSAVFLLVASSWFLLLVLRIGWQPVVDFFLEENIGRYTHLELGPERGFLYYPGVFLGDFFPWSIFFIPALIWVIRKGHSGSKPLVFLLCWIGAYLLFFSFSLNKQEHYLLPLYPAAALWVSSYLRQGHPSRLFLALMAVLILILGTALYLVVDELFSGTTAAWIPPLLLVVAAAFLFFQQFGWMLIALVLFYSAGFALYLKPLEQYRPVRYFAETLRAERRDAGDGQAWRAGYYRLATPSLAFYLNRPILELFELDKAETHLRSPDPVYLIMRSQDYPELAKAANQALRIVSVRPKLYTTVRGFIEGFRPDGMDRSQTDLRRKWTQPVYLVTNQQRGIVGGGSGLQ